MANLHNIDRVIAKIKDEQNFFDMSNFSDFDKKNNCGTASCIGGWAADIWLRDNKLRVSCDAIDCTDDLILASFLGISEEQATELFDPEHKPLDSITRQEAIATLENLKATDTVEWVVL